MQLGNGSCLCIYWKSAGLQKVMKKLKTMSNKFTTTHNSASCRSNRKARKTMLLLEDAFYALSKEVDGQADTDETLGERQYLCKDIAPLMQLCEIMLEQQKRTLSLQK